MKKALLILTFISIAILGKSTGIQVGIGSGFTYNTISAACTAGVIKAGDTVYVHAGVYTDNLGMTGLIGTSSQWITIRPYKNDSVSIQNEYTVTNVAYLKITGLNFYGNNSIRKTSSGSTAVHLLFFSGAPACYTSIHDIIVQNCKFTDLNNTGYTVSTGDMLKIDNTNNFQVLNCLFENGTNITDGIGLNADKNGLVKNCRFENIGTLTEGTDGSHCKGGSIYITYEANLFINCGGSGLDIGGDTGTPYFCPAYNAATSFEADSCYVFSNIFIGGYTSIRLGSCWNTEVYNNTCFKIDGFALRTLNESQNPIYVKNNHVYNNIFTTYTSFGIYMNFTGQKTTDYYSTEFFYNNLFHSYKGADPSSINWNEDFVSPVVSGAVVSGSIIGDPQFNDTTSMDFSLKSGSPAIAKGYSVSSPAMDYNGSNFGTKRSIGAIEYAGNTLGVTNYEEANHIVVYPNPSTGEFNVSWTGTGTIQNVEIYNMLGQLTYAVRPSGYTTRFNLSAMPKGVYKAVFYTNNGSVSTSTLLLD